MGCLQLFATFYLSPYLSVNLNIMHELCINITISLTSTLLSYLTILYDPYFITNDHSYFYFNTTFMTLHNNATWNDVILYHSLPVTIFSRLTLFRINSLYNTSLWDYTYFIHLFLYRYTYCYKKLWMKCLCNT